MKSLSNEPNARNLALAIFTDIQFWIPVIILIGGLWVLNWIR